MIAIDFPEPTTPACTEDVVDAWQAWRRQCEQARRNLEELGSREEYASIKVAMAKRRLQTLYKHDSMKRVYKSSEAPFFGKCAYCECAVLAGGRGDIEHWRPKGAVADWDWSQVRMTTRDGTAIPHPGYYWLAFEWTNLLLSCALCNQRVSGLNGAPFGKWTRFPVKEYRAIAPGQESQEEPLLLNPLFDDPSDHLGVDSLGGLVATTAEGQMCVDIFGLNVREPLRLGRKRVLESTAILVLGLRLYARGHVNDASEGRRLRERVRDIERGKVPYAAAARKVLDDFFAEIKMTARASANHDAGA